ncbi:hypothetical protein KAJ83_09615 [Marivibrio halodurans]|uniref:Uncharacterized protein n=1 Tax=Marivibrio halodurans TaxID=2039722 RepID=A0A8J7V2F1_9PROT|nr:hypothetical protein [Marivibrio halodurans]MBP5857265.1 hypothetical protein [Marivibrio halodurans]
MPAALAHTPDTSEELLDELLFWSATLAAHPMNRAARRRVRALCEEARGILKDKRGRERLIAAIDAAEAAAREAHGYRADLEG